MGKVWSLKDAGLAVEEIGKDSRKAVSAGMLAAAYRGVQYIVSDIIPSFGHPPVDRGLYRAGWRAGKLGSGAYIENKTPIASIIEQGARAKNIRISRAMITALAAWVKRKGIGGRQVTSKDGRTRHVKASQAEATSIAWAIAKSFQKKGIFPPRGLRVMEKASKKFPAFISEEVSKKLKEAGIGK
jgi:hypothetical protein